MPKKDEVVVWEEKFPMISQKKFEALDNTINNIATGDIKPREAFAMIPNPKGEAEWAIKLPTGKKIFEELNGIILYVGNIRTYYEAEYGTVDVAPPDCSSPDGITGTSKIEGLGGQCIDCELGEFGPNGEPPRCSQKKPIYMLIPEVNANKPVVINLTGPNFPIFKKFNLELDHAGVNIFDIKVKLTLTVKETKTKQKPSVVQFEADGMINNDIESEAYKTLMEYKNKVLSIVNPNYAEMQAAMSA